MNASRIEIVKLIRDGLSNAAIARQLRCDSHRVGRIRHELGLPNLPAQPLTLEEKWAARTVPVDGGHLRWTGERPTASGTPVLRYKGRTFTAAAIAFRIRTGRDPVGHAIADCGYPRCVAPDHVEDTPGRERTRGQLRAITGRRERPAQCRHGHDQAVHGSFEADGRSYCKACKDSQRTRAASPDPEVGTHA
jgi:hypothetical protein